ncbi:hypothetical protein AMK16_27055 [Streptomyces sp. CB00455]|uniref:hypothetical protein n=1 Tax=Streptomyces sp. CB00455 TaxID=1703927 RepID=UPI0009697D8E|nr:hypothetical protein AMK16_27055 [Streptomyces sp. CB00455]
MARGQDPRPPAGYRYPLATADGWIAPSDACAAAAAAYDLRELPTAAALSQLRDHGLAATAVTLPQRLSMTEVLPEQSWSYLLASICTATYSARSATGV